MYGIFDHISVNPTRQKSRIEEVANTFGPHGKRWMSLLASVPSDLETNGRLCWAVFRVDNKNSNAREHRIRFPAGLGLFHIFGIGKKIRVAARLG